MNQAQSIEVHTDNQTLLCFEQGRLCQTYSVSTSQYGLGEIQGSYCTPRGLHCIHAVIGLEHALNSVFVGRQWTGELYSQALALQHPDRDWILTRILQLQGLEPGRNALGEVDSLSRYIYIHGIPDEIKLGVPLSHGCIRMRNADIIALANWVKLGTPVWIGI
jgi:hypothetical protein